MIIERSMDPGFLSNAWLLADRPGGTALFVDAGGPPDPLIAAVERHGLRPALILLTHHHVDHVTHAAALARRYACPVAAHPAEAARIGGVDREIRGGDTLEAGELRIGVLHVPGHTDGQLSFVIEGAGVCTGDTLFRGTVGGTRAPGHATFADLRRSILDVLMELPGETAVLPGHTDPTTIAAEAARNPFIRAWRGEEPVRARPCTAFGRAATLLLRAPDYDGGTKCWVRWDDGTEDVVPGSRVQDR